MLSLGLQTSKINIVDRVQCTYMYMYKYTCTVCNIHVHIVYVHVYVCCSVVI